MNTLEIKIDHKIKRIQDFYKYARKQFYDYEKIEGIDNWLKYDFCIDCSEDQMKFKDMLQIRFIEELTEASMALNDQDHFYEEITDSLNFLVSSYIMLNTNLIKLPNPENYLSKKFKKKKLNKKTFAKLFYPVIEKTGYLCNLLKNRPWAQSNYLVSMIDFNERLEDLWITYFKTIGKIGIDKKTLYELFERKLNVNKWRIQTGY